MIIEEIVSQHAEESAFLWLLRDNAVRAPHYDLKDLADLEERVEAHLDGLRVAGEEAWPFCAQGLEYQEAGEVFAAGFFALDAGRQDWLESVLEVVVSTPKTLRGLLSALGWVDRERLKGRVVEWLNSDQPVLRQMGIGACGVQRVDCGAHLDRAIADDDAAVRARALRCAGDIRRRNLLPMIVKHLCDEDEDCRFQAARSATLLDDSQGLQVLRKFVESPGPLRETAVQLALRAMDRATAVEFVREMNRQPESARLVVTATGIIGDPASIPWLIEKMKQPGLARVAGESFSMMTGLDLAYDDLEMDQPEDFQAGPTEEPEDEDIAMDPDEDLPWPSPELISRWWSEHQSEFRLGQRYLCGRPITNESCKEVLRKGLQRQRRAAALELALLNPNDMLFNTSATAKRQIRQLGDY